MTPLLFIFIIFLSCWLVFCRMNCSFHWFHFTMTYITVQTGGKTIVFGVNPLVGICSKFPSGAASLQNSLRPCTCRIAASPGSRDVRELFAWMMYKSLWTSGRMAALASFISDDGIKDGVHALQDYTLCLMKSSLIFRL